MWIAKHDRKLWTTACKINVKVNDKFCYLMVFNIKSWIKPWNVILIIFPNYPTFLYVPKQWKSMFFFRFFLDGQLFIDHSFQLCFGTFFSHMTHMHAFYPPPFFFYNKWSTTSWSKSLKTCNFEDCPKLNLNFNNNNCSFSSILIQFFFSIETFRFKSPKTSSTQVFKFSKPCMTFRHICKGQSIFCTRIILVKC